MLGLGLQTVSGGDELAVTYYSALDDLTCLIEPAEGAEGGVSPPVVIRQAIDRLVTAALIPPSSDLIVMLEVLAHRFEEVLDRKDLDL